MSKQDAHASESDEAEEILFPVLVASDQSTEVLEPREEPLDLPPIPISTKCSTVLGSRPSSIRFVRCDQLDSALLTQLNVQRIRVVSTISDHAVRVVGQEGLLERRLDESSLMRRSACDPHGERKTSAVCHCHDLGALAPLRFSDARAPFLAPAKVPSMKDSERSKPPRLCRSWAMPSRIRSIVPSRHQRWNRRWQV